MKVFVTGATGFIGRVLVQKLISQGDKVIALVRRAEHDLHKDVKIVYGDILSPDNWKDSVSGCSRFYHLAGMVSFDPRKRKQLLRENGVGTSNILKVALDAGVGTTLIVSSASTVGLSYRSDLLLDEKSVLDPWLINCNPYLESKLLAEKSALGSSSHHKVIIVNPTTVYGPGDWTLNSGTLIKMIATSSILPVPSGGSNVVDVEDVAEGIMLAASHGFGGARYILGGENLRFEEIFLTIARVIGKKPVFINLPGFMGPSLSCVVSTLGRWTHSRFLSAQLVNNLFAFKYYSTSLAQEQLGFKARNTFSQSVERAWAFYRQNNLI